MSDSELSATVPGNAQLERGLRNAVKRLRREDPDAITINNVRRAAEKQLGVDQGFFNEANWKDKSKVTIKAQVEKDEDSSEEEDALSPKPETKRKPGKTASAKRKAANTKEPAKRKKRRVSNVSDSEEAQNSVASASPSPAASSDSESDFDQDEPASKPKMKSKKHTSTDTHDELEDVKASSNTKAVKKVLLSKRAASSELSDVDSATPAPAAPTTTKARVEASDSEMSILIDDSPPPKSKQRSTSAGKRSSTKEKPAKAKSSKEATAPDPDSEEIKKLQGQLGQCGIRKVWGKYLKPYETPRAKIKHLRDLLVEAGVTGRFSLEKAKQIREQRELAADLEAVTEGNKVWGRRKARKDTVEEDTEARPKRGLAKGLAELDFISDGEED